MKLHAEGVRYEDLSFRFCISIRTLSRWKKAIEPQKTRNNPWKKLSKEALIQDILDHPDSYSHERAKRLGITASGIKYAIKADSAKRSMFCQTIKRLEKACKSIAYIDESGFDAKNLLFKR
ncbi:IS630 family transposase domain protein [Candidatus Cyrtobacter comes]|uniref:IS630 family transposase domain protein n=2 Tax=Candidatus Cyrtobacter comes TaxID=675776 RepID=A0ABU5L7Y5_9RICK|nr:IS630 family transposase domain protein [Candidatus Cyrtobacter comes]